MAAAAAPADDSISILGLGVADGSWRLGSFDDRLCARDDRNLPTGPERIEFSYAIGCGGKNFRMVGGYRLCCESKSDLFANHGNDRGSVPRSVCLDSCVLLRIRAASNSGRSGTASLCFLFLDEVRSVSGGNVLHPVRRMVPDSGDTRYRSGRVS